MDSVSKSPRTKFKFTVAEKSWMLYDWANSVYATNIMAAIFPIYFVKMAGELVDGDGCGRSVLRSRHW